MNVQSYLQRINYHGPLEPDQTTLIALQLAHLRTVPFENLDVLLGRPIVLDLESLFDKIVTRRRGGFCYELNGLFGALLETLGYQVTYLSAGVAHKDGGFGPEFDHLTLQVTPRGIPLGSAPSPYLADVGFGDTFIEPLRFDGEAEQPQDGRTYRIRQEEGSFVLWQQGLDEAWEPQYRFTLAPRSLGDFREMCQYHQTSPASSFTQKRICTLATPGGRITLTESRLIITDHGKRREELIAGETQVRQVLLEKFGVDLSLE